MRDVEEQRLVARGRDEDGLGAGVAHGRGGRPGHAAEAGDGEALEQRRGEGQLGVFDKIVFEDGGLLGFAEESESAAGLQNISMRRFSNETIRL